MCSNTNMHPVVLHSSYHHLEAPIYLSSSTACSSGIPPSTFPSACLQSHQHRASYFWVPRGAVLPGLYQYLGGYLCLSTPAELGAHEYPPKPCARTLLRPCMPVTNNMHFTNMLTTNQHYKHSNNVVVKT